MRLVLKVVVGLSIALLILFAAGFVVLRTMDLDQYKEFIASTVENATGRMLVIEGDIQVRPSLIPTIVVEGIAFRNPGFATQPNMLTLRRLEGELELLPLLRGEVVIKRIQLIEPTLVFERARGGMRNWRFPKGDRGQMPALHIQKATIRDGRIIYLNSDIGTRVDFFIDDVQGHLRPGSDIIEVAGRGGWKYRDWQDVSIEVEGTLGSLASFFNATPTEIDVTGRTDDVNWRVTGTVAEVVRLSGLDLRLHGTTDSFANLASFAPFSLPALGPVVATANLTGDRPSYDVRDIDAQLQSDKYQARLTGSIESLVFADRMQLNLAATAESAVGAGTAFGLQWPLDGVLTTNLRLAGERQKGYGLPALDMGLRGAGLSADLSGSVARIPGLQGLVLDATLRAEQLGVLAPAIERDLPPLGPLVATARLTRDTTGLRIDTLRANLSDDRLAASATGAVGDALAMRDVELDVTITADQLAALAEVTGHSLPNLGRLRLDAALVRHDDAFRVESLAGSLRGDAIDASVSGLVDDLRGIEGLDLDYQLRVDSLGSLSELVGTTLPDTDSLSGQGRLYYAGAGSHQLHLDTDLRGTDFSAKIAATVADITRFRDARATVQLDAASLEELARIAQRSLPRWGPLKMAGTFHYDAPSASPVEVEAMFTSGTTSARVEGVLDEGAGDGAVDLRVDITSDTLASLSRFVNKELPDAGPLRARGRVRNTEAGYDFEDLDVVAGASDFKGRLAWTLDEPGAHAAQSRPRLSGEIVSRRLDLRPYMAEGGAQPPAMRSPFVFSPEPFDFDLIRGYDVDLRVRAGQFRFKQTRLGDVRLHYKALDGVLELPITAALNPGEINGRLIVDTTRTPASIELQLYATDVDTEQISALQGDGMFQEGNININMELAGSGDSMRQWIANSDGHLLLVINRGKVSQPVLRLIGADILWQVANIVNPFNKKRDFLELECGVMGFRVRDGVARSDRWIATQSREVTVLGAGLIDLGREGVQIALRPKAREGIGISASSLVKMVRIGGTIKDLKPEADPSGLLQSGASIGAAVFSGGLTILAQGLYDRFTANQDVCETTHRSFIRNLTDPDAETEVLGRGNAEIIRDK